MPSADHWGPAFRKAVRVVAVASLVLAACREEPFPPTRYNPDWTPASPGESAKPNYSVVFPEDSANRIDILMTAATWTAIRKNMTALWGFDFGAGTHPCCGPYP